MKTYEELQVENERLVADNERLVAQVEMLREVANDAIYFATKRKDKVCADPMFVMQQLQGRIGATPLQCLNEIRAEAGRAGFVAGYDAGHEYRFSNLGDELADEYAEKVRNGE